MSERTWREKRSGTEWLWFMDAALSTSQHRQCQGRLRSGQWRAAHCKEGLFSINTKLMFHLRALRRLSSVPTPPSTHWRSSRWGSSFFSRLRVDFGVQDQGGGQAFFVPRSCGPVHHTTKVARHALHMHTHNTHTTHPNTFTHKYTCNIQTTHATHIHTTPSHHQIQHHHTTTTPSPHAPPRQLHISHTASPLPRPKTHQQRIAVEKQISLCLRKLLATVSSGHCQKKFAAVMAHMTSTVKTTNANFTISFETAIMIRSMSDKNRSLSLDIWHPLAMNRGLGVHWLGTTRASHIRDDTRKRGRDPTMKSEGTQPLLQRSGSIVRHSGIHC